MAISAIIAQTALSTSVSLLSSRLTVSSKPPTKARTISGESLACLMQGTSARQAFRLITSLGCFSRDQTNRTPSSRCSGSLMMPIHLSSLAHSFSTSGTFSSNGSYVALNSRICGRFRSAFLTLRYSDSRNNEKGKCHAVWRDVNSINHSNSTRGTQVPPTRNPIFTLFGRLHLVQDQTRLEALNRRVGQHIDEITKTKSIIIIRSSGNDENLFNSH